jgi:hypothetical protein
MFEGHIEEGPEMACASLLEGLPLVYSSLEEHQGEDEFCKATKEGVLKNEKGYEKYQLHKGLLCYCPKGAQRRRWVVPSVLRAMLLKYFHDSVLSGHLGAFKTLRRVMANFWWPRMRTEVFQYVRKCDACQRAKPAQHTAVGLHSSSPVSSPLERIFVDFVGPLPRTRRGNSAILVVLDGFSKFVWFYAVRKMSSAVVTECLERYYVPAFGTPAQIVSDNATVFRSKVFKDMCFRWGTEHFTTTPYYPQASLAERVNRNLKAALKIYHSASQDKWDVDLPWIATALNTAVHESTQFTPDMLFLGREIKGPLETKWDLSPIHEDHGNSVNVSFWRQAFKNLKHARDRVAERYNQRRKEHTFKVGDYIMFRRHLVSSKAQNVSAKLMLRWSDPVVIAEILRTNVVLFANPDTGVILRRAHVSQLKAYVN